VTRDSSEILNGDMPLSLVSPLYLGYKNILGVRGNPLAQTMVRRVDESGIVIPTE